MIIDKIKFEADFLNMSTRRDEDGVFCLSASKHLTSTTDVNERDLAVAIAEILNVYDYRVAFRQRKFGSLRSTTQNIDVIVCVPTNIEHYIGVNQDDFRGPVPTASYLQRKDGTSFEFYGYPNSGYNNKVAERVYVGKSSYKLIDKADVDGLPEFPNKDVFTKKEQQPIDENDRIEFGRAYDSRNAHYDQEEDDDYCDYDEGQASEDSDFAMSETDGYWD